MQSTVNICQKFFDSVLEKCTNLKFHSCFIKKTFTLHILAIHNLQLQKKENVIAWSFWLSLIIMKKCDGKFGIGEGFLFPTYHALQ